MSDVSKAVEMFRGGCACSQAILAVYGARLGLPREQALQLAAGFAGGMRLGETCGAVAGAFMVLGLRHGSTDCGQPAGRTEVYARVLDFAERFKQRNGSLTCRDLLGCDISTAEGMKQAREQNLFKTTCVQIVRDAAEILEEMGCQQEPEDDGNTIAPG
jgi:C_GCAxxG_C_C family probable redox protein